MANPQLQVKVVTSGQQADVLVVGHGDNVGQAFGDDKDFVIVLNSAGLSANDELDDVIVGTSVHQGVAANSAILSNITDDGDILMLVNDGGHSKEFLLANGDTADLQLGHGMATVNIKTASGAITLSAAAGADIILGDDNEVLRVVNDGTVGMNTSTPGVNFAGGTADYNSDETFEIAGGGRSFLLLAGTTDSAVVFGDSGQAANSRKFGIVYQGGALDFKNITDAGKGTTGTPYLSISAAGVITVAANIVPEADGTRDLGTQTTAQFANLWSDAVNGADFGYDNGWRTLEADTYYGYGPGIAFDFGDYFETGKALAVKYVKVGEEPVLDEDGNPTGEVTDIMERRQVRNVRETPVFAITDDWIEFKGHRVTPDKLEKLLALV